MQKLNAGSELSHNWIDYARQQPIEGLDLWYYCEEVGVHQGQFCGADTFAGPGGWLTGDVTHWQYDQGQSRPTAPQLK